jgi:hypothetical protein
VESLHLSVGDDCVGELLVISSVSRRWYWYKLSLVMVDGEVVEGVAIEGPHGAGADVDPAHAELLPQLNILH